MGNLIKISAGALSIRNKADMNEYLKPMSRDILLFTTKIGNTYRLNDKAPLLALEVGNKLIFKKGNSKYDNDQIEIYTSDNKLVGYVPEADNSVFARLMEAGKMLFAIVKSKSSVKSIPIIEIDIFLQDF